MLATKIRTTIATLTATFTVAIAVAPIAQAQVFRPDVMKRKAQICKNLQTVYEGAIEGPYRSTATPTGRTQVTRKPRRAIRQPTTLAPTARGRAAVGSRSHGSPGAQIEGRRAPAHAGAFCCPAPSCAANCSTRPTPEAEPYTMGIARRNPS